MQIVGDILFANDRFTLAFSKTVVGQQISKLNLKTELRLFIFFLTSLDIIAKIISTKYLELMYNSEVIK